MNHMLLPLLSALLSLPALDGATPPAPAAVPADDHLVARAGDLPISREDYAEWLLLHYGVLHLDDFVGQRMVLHAAEQAGLSPSAEEVQAAYEAERDHIVTEFFRGDIDFYEREHVVRRGYDLASYQRLRVAALEVELAQQALALSERVVTEQQVLQRYRNTFGEDGERIAIDVLFFNMYSESKAETPADPAVLRDGALERARFAIDNLRGGTPLADLLDASDWIRSEFVIDGHVDPYRRELLGREIEIAVASLDTPGEIAPPVAVYNGYYVVRLAERRKVSLEEARDDITTWLENREVDSEEMANVLTRLRANTTVERLLH